MFKKNPLLKSGMNRILIPVFALLVLLPLSAFADTSLDYSNLYKYNLVQVGNVIFFTNTDTQPHTIAGHDRQGNAITSGPIQPNQTIQMLFSDKGQFDFYDELNQNNHGTIEVYQQSSDLTKSDQNQTVNGWAATTSPVFSFSNATMTFNYSNQTNLTTSTSTTNTTTNDTNTTSTQTPPDNATPTVQNGWQNSTLPAPPSNTQTTPEPTITTSPSVTQQPTTQTTTSSSVMIISPSNLAKSDSLRASLGLPPLETIMNVQLTN